MEGIFREALKRPLWCWAFLSLLFSEEEAEGWVGWTVTANSKSPLGLCPASLAPECASRLRWLLWEDRTLHLHILSVPSVGKLKRPLARSPRSPTMNQKESCASPTQPPLRTKTSPFSWAPRPAWRNQIVITGSITDAAVALAWSHVFLHLVIIPPTSRPEPRRAQTAPAGSSNPWKEGPEGWWFLDAAPGTCRLWSFSTLESGWPYFCLPWREAFTVSLPPTLLSLSPKT